MKLSSRKIFRILPLVLLTGLLISCGTQPPVEEGMTQAEVTAHVQKTIAVFNTGDVSTVDEIYSPAYVRRDKALPEDVVGLEAFKNYVGMLRTAYPDFRVTTNEVLKSGDKIIMRWTVTGTHAGPLITSAGEIPPTNKSFSVPGVSITTIRDGKTAEEFVFYNQHYVYLQLGIVTITPSIEETPEEPPEKK